MKDFFTLTWFRGTKTSKENSRRLNRGMRKGRGVKQSRTLYSLILLHHNGIQSSAIEGTENEIHWHGIFPNNLLFGGFLWLFTLLPGKLCSVSLKVRTNKKIKHSPR